MVNSLDWRRLLQPIDTRTGAVNFVVVVPISYAMLLDIVICPLAIDRGYNDYAWYKHLTDNERLFVTRFKPNAKIQVIKCPMLLRRIGYRDPVMGKRCVLFTNNFKLAAKTIADIYKARWDVEFFFKRWCYYANSLMTLRNRYSRAPSESSVSLNECVYS
jgi:IS4 transposase